MKILDFVICDDIRDEANNKVSLMGIYNSRINIRTKSRDNLKFPIIMPTLSVYVRVESLVIQDKCHIKVERGTETVFEHAGRVLQVNDETLVVKWKISPFFITEGDFKFTLSLTEKGSEKVTSLDPYILRVCVEIVP